MQLATPFRILLLGGSSGVGKTGLAQELGRHFGIPALMVDDIRMAVQEMTTPEQQPDLHYFFTDRPVWEEEPETLRDGLIKVARVLSPALQIVMAHHLVVEGSGPIIMEGDGILPELAVAPRLGQGKHFAGLNVTDAVKAVFLYEPEEAAIYENMLARGRGFQNISTEQQQRQVRASWLYGQWLRQQAETYNLPVVEVRPWSGLTERVMQHLS